MQFEPMAKIPRWSRGCIITEKIDGTNASIMIVKEGTVEAALGVTAPPESQRIAVAQIGQLDHPTSPGFVGHIFAGSRTRLVTPGKQDNYGFAAWVQANANELIKLGPGLHFGEWWGSGIQRGYGLSKGDKRFSLFDTRWAERENKPACCGVVPVLYRGPLEGYIEQGYDAVRIAMDVLRTEGSMAAPGFMKPEGIIIWHSAVRQFFKKTFEKDQEGKGE